MHAIYTHSSKQCIHFLSSKSERRGCCISNESAKSHINGNRQKQRCSSGGIKGCVIEFSGGESSSLFRLELDQGGERSPSLLRMRERAAWRPSLGGTSPMNYSQIGKASYRLLSIPQFPPFCHLCAAFFMWYPLFIISIFVTGAELCIVTVKHQRMLSGFSFSLFLLRTHSAVQIIKSIVHTKMNSVISLTLITPHITDFQTSKRTQKHHKSAFKCLCDSWTIFPIVSSHSLRLIDWVLNWLS